MAMRFYQLFALVKKEFLVLVRDRHALAVLFLMPIAFIFLLSIALKDVFAEKAGAKVAVEVINHDGDGKFARELISHLKKRAQFEVWGGKIPPVKSATGVRRLKAKLVIPAGAGDDFEAMMENPNLNPADLKAKLALEMDPTVDSSYRWFLRATVGTILYEMLMTRLGRALKETPLKDKFAVFDKDRNISPASFLQDEVAGGARLLPSPLQQNVPGWSLFAMFFIAVPLASGILKERQDGTVKRLLTFPVARSTVIAGKLIPYALVNVVQFILMLLVGLYLVPLCSDLTFSLGSRWQTLIPVTLVAAVAATSFGVFISCISHSIEHASALAAGCVICMAALGGIMVPVFAMPDFMQSLAPISPLYWGHQAYLDVLVREAPLATIAPKLAVLALFSVVAILVGQRRFQWL